MVHTIHTGVDIMTASSKYVFSYQVPRHLGGHYGHGGHGHGGGSHTAVKSLHYSVTLMKQSDIM